MDRSILNIDKKFVNQTRVMMSDDLISNRNGSRNFYMLRLTGLSVILCTCILFRGYIILIKICFRATVCSILLIRGFYDDYRIHIKISFVFRITLLILFFLNGNFFFLPTIIILNREYRNIQAQDKTI